MPADRFFIPLPLSQSVTLYGEELHHLHVMRIRQGETVELVNGQGELAEAVVERIEKKEATLTIKRHEKAIRPSQELILAQALTRPTPLEWIVEKGTELGVTQFWLFPGEESEKKAVSPTQHRRLETISQQALKQCGRMFLPSIDMKPPLSEWNPIEGSLFYGDVSHAPKLHPPFDKKVLILIGPEKGFTTNEIEKMRLLGAKNISLHTNILRAETAAIAAVSQFYSLAKI